jgi:diguanylate cyclase (GGDEF)-like protein
MTRLMRDDSLIALKIGQNTPSTTAAALRPVLDRALALIGYVLLAVEDEKERQELTAKLDHFRNDFSAATDPAAIGGITESCFAMCEHAVQALQSQQNERRSELRRLVALVRDTVALLVGDGNSFSTDIAAAAGRFNALLRINDVQQLKQRLIAEVGDLQRLAVERQQQWQQTVSMFEARIVTLEKQLVAVKQEASVDPLTGIANRRSFELAVRDALKSPDRELVVAVLDLDDFKTVNDTGGHAAGDRLLQTVAQHLKGSVRRNDVVARIGGDEFAILGAGATLRAAEPRLRQIVAALGNIATGLERPAFASASCGLAEYCAGDTLESIMRRADQALYDAKRQGKHRLVVKNPPFIRDLLNRRA